ncbi:MAG: ribbon-helix-helix domain-containing protein [Vitreimonas sp.]
MTVKTSISLTDSQEAFARELVERGRFPSLSAVLQRGLEMLREETEAHEGELAALRALLEERAKGPFISMEESRAEIEEIIADLKESDFVVEDDDVQA